MESKMSLAETLAGIDDIDTLYPSHFTAHGQVRGKMAPPNRFQHNMNITLEHFRSPNFRPDSGRHQDLSFRDKLSFDLT